MHQLPPERLTAFVTTVEAEFPAGLFGAAQGLTDDQEMVRRQGHGLTWCSSAAEFIARFPLLEQSQNEQYPDEVDCIDLTAGISPEGLVTQFELEGAPVGDGVVGHHVDSAGPRAAEHLRRLFLSGAARHDGGRGA